MDAGSQGAPLPGWYRDPWNADRRRYWDGQAWTGHVYAGPDAPDEPVWPASSYVDVAVAAPDRAPEAAADEPPFLRPSAAALPPPPPPPLSPAPPPPADPAPPARSRLARWTPMLLVLAVAVGLAGGLGAVYAATGGFRDSEKSASPEPTPTNPTTPGVLPPALGLGRIPASPSSDPAAARLSDLIVRQDDVTSGVNVLPLSGGNLVSGAPTLDICNATYPSESKRTARLQVVATDDQGQLLLSTEAVLYGNPAATAQAFDELKATAAKCPATPVASPTGGSTFTTKFNPSPDGAWPKVDTVERQAYDITTTDEQGDTQRTVAVYLHRGRVLIGVYFANPDGPQPAVNGQTTMAGIVNVFASRLAKLPPEVVNG